MGGGKIEDCHYKDAEIRGQNPIYVKRLLQVDIICYWFAEYCTCENLCELLQSTFAGGVSGLLQLECIIQAQNREDNYLFKEAVGLLGHPSTTTKCIRWHFGGVKGENCHQTKLS